MDFSGCADCAPCTPVTITSNSSDEEFWTFTAHPEQKVPLTVFYGIVPVGPAIPAGRIKVSVRVAGSEKVCEAARQSVARGRPVNDLESGAPGTPTESCMGPGFFKRAEGSVALTNSKGDSATVPATSTPAPEKRSRTCNNPISSSCPPSESHSFWRNSSR